MKQSKCNCVVPILLNSNSFSKECVTTLFLACSFFLVSLSLFLSVFLPPYPPFSSFVRTKSFYRVHVPCQKLKFLAFYVSIHFLSSHEACHITTSFIFQTYFAPMINESSSFGPRRSSKLAAIKSKLQ